MRDARAKNKGDLLGNKYLLIIYVSNQCGPCYNLEPEYKRINDRIHIKARKLLPDHIFKCVDILIFSVLSSSAKHKLKGGFVSIYLRCSTGAGRKL